MKKSSGEGKEVRTESCEVSVILIFGVIRKNMLTVLAKEVCGEKIL